MTTPDESTDTARIAALLGEHDSLPRLAHYCRCGWTPDPERDRGKVLSALHRAHVAAVLVEAGVGFVAQAKAEERERIAQAIEDGCEHPVVVKGQRPLYALGGFCFACTDAARAAREDAR
jgi:hypothetical protein